MKLEMAGYAVRYNEVVEQCGESIVVLPGAFSKAFNTGRAVRLLRDHMEDQFIGSTNDILKLWDDGDTGLAFGVSSIPKTKRGEHLRYMAEDAKYDSVSVGFDYVNAHKVWRTINGTTVICILFADLQEISILSGYDNGACKQSFAVYGDFESLEEECRSGRLLRESAAVQFRRAVRRYQINH